MAVRGLKVSISLKTPFFLSRFTTLDSILLSLHYGRIYNETRDAYNDKGTDFILKDGGSFSGSIWFVEGDEIVIPYTDSIIRMTDGSLFKGIFGIDIREIGKSRINSASGEYRTLMNFYERLIARKIYFYIDADPDRLTNLLKKLKTVGKKGKYGWGLVESFTIEDADNYRGFYLNKYTPSKPLPIRGWGDFIETDRIAYFRPQPPYWLKTGVELCFMPHTALVERVDTQKAEGRVYIPDEQIAPSTLIATCYTPDKKQLSKVNIDDNAEGVCAFCGRKMKGGIKLKSVKDLYSAASNSFVDFHSLVAGADLVCKDCFVALKSIKTVFRGGTIQVIKQGENMSFSPNSKGVDVKKVIMDILKNPDLPYLFSWKTTTNLQHTFFKGNCQATISELMPVVCRGDGTTLYIDRDVFLEALEDANELNDLYKKLTKSPEGAKTILTTRTISKAVGITPISSKALKNKDYVDKLIAYWRKYDLSTRIMLHFFLTGKTGRR